MMSHERKYLSKSTKEKVFEKYNNKCAYCGCQLEKGYKAIDHLVSIHYGHIKGLSSNLNDLSNLMPACSLCNMKKSIMSLEEFRGYIEYRVEIFLKNSSDYRLASNYNIVPTKTKPVVFYFETMKGEG